MPKKARKAIEEMLAEARDDVKHADQKASVILAALGIGFGAVLGGQLSGNFDPSLLSLSGQIVWWAGVVLAAASVTLAVLAVWPRYNLDDSPVYGVTYWGHIAALKSLDELEDALAEQDTTSDRRTNHQLWKLSGLVLKKYRYVRVALVCGAVAGLLLAVASIVTR